MPRGRSTKPTVLPDAFKSWQDLFEKWEEYLANQPRSVHPSRTSTFAALHDTPEWILGTIPYIFRTARREDEVGAFAREMIEKINRGEIGAPKANNEIRAYQQQNPLFRRKETQLAALEQVENQLRQLAKLADSVRNLNNEIAPNELEYYFSKISTHVRKIQQLKNRISQALRDKEGGV